MTHIDRKTLCECNGPGFCPRHRCRKTPFYFLICATRPDWFAKYEAGEGPCIHGTPADGVEVSPLIPARGAGDKLARGLRALRIDGPLKRIVRFIKRKAGAENPSDCGCAGRQGTLNQLFPTNANTE